RTGASVINGAIRTWYLSHGGPSGSLGLPVGPETRLNGSSRQEFEHGALIWTAEGGVRLATEPVPSAAPGSLAEPSAARPEEGQAPSL
uniref:LGFP repeat-containing protein n=1 Tax=Leucobacter chironomi TaxID=491918 RepID=UPI003B84546C